ncbi:hypothetical protein BS47DRAFT_1360552 [Hydnum rufescens UP504]|uniref:Uncharacterized protein n=1 Tax=Hydnum rufescens UP504 TaxID=1448309 RepID=A0A9P6DYY4_9AGAM|nr:hypothetical protein BS47DRAFT_1360552 [Hydnum rufescens UP504]
MSKRMNEQRQCPQEATTKSRKTESHTPAEAGQHIPPQCAKSRSHKPNLRARQDPMKRRTPLCMNMPTNEGQHTPEATGNEGATHPLRRVCGHIKPRCPTPTREVTQPQAQPVGPPRPHETPHPITHKRANEQRTMHARSHRGNEGATHPLRRVCGHIKPRRPTPMRKPRNREPKPCV